MAKYVLVYTGGGMPETEAEQAAVLAKWGQWYESMGGAVIDGGAPFSPIVKSIASNGGISDGAIGAPASGYTILAADSIDAATAMAQKCPILASGGQISIYETIEMG